VTSGTWSAGTGSPQRSDRVTPDLDHGFVAEVGLGRVRVDPHAELAIAETAGRQARKLRRVQ
jgi:hypothetical protein